MGIAKNSLGAVLNSERARYLIGYCGRKTKTFTREDADDEDYHAGDGNQRRTGLGHSGLRAPEHRGRHGDPIQTAERIWPAFRDAVIAAMRERNEESGA